MSALAEALVAAQRRALTAMQKQYAAGRIDADTARSFMNSTGLTDAVDQDRLLFALDAISTWGAEAPAETNGGGTEPKKASEGQVKYALDLFARSPNVTPLAEGDIRALTFERASELIDALKGGSYNPTEWDVPF